MTYKLFTWFLLSTLGYCQVSTQSVELSLSLSLSSFETGFLDRFSFTVTNSSNGGSTAYVSKVVGLSTGLIRHNADMGSLRLDTRLANSQRQSVRMNSRSRFTTGIFVFDLDHVPKECGAWPSLWLVGKTFDEIDILENINQRNGYVNFHTAARACKSRNEQADQTARILGRTCSLGEAAAGGLKGCIQGLLPEQLDFGQVKGSLVVALGGPARDRVGVYYAPRDSVADIYLHMRMATGSLRWDDLGRLGKPLVDFKKPECKEEERDTGDMFKDMQLVINTNFCGGWAQGDWNNGCAKQVGTNTCSAHVLGLGPPEGREMKSSYWQFRSIRFYSESQRVNSVVQVGANGGFRVGMRVWLVMLVSLCIHLYIY